MYFAIGNRWAANLYSVQADGSNLKQVTHGEELVKSDPCVAPDGKTIAFASSTPPPQEVARIWAMGSDGSNLRRLTDGTLDCYASYSPDGRKLLFVRESPPGGWNIWEMQADGSSPRQLTYGVYYRTDRPSFSPNGKTVVFGADVAPFDQSIHQILTFDILADGRATVPRPVPLPPFPIVGSSFPFQYDGDPSYSPDGSRIVFISTRASRRAPFDYDVWTCKADGSELRQITFDQSIDQFPRFSPDMSCIYYGTDYGELRRQNVDAKTFGPIGRPRTLFNYAAR
jgi:Tol biopolymer transport system component